MADKTTILARRLDALRREVRALSTQPRLAYSSIEDGAVDVYVDDTQTMVIGQQHDGTSTAATVTGPVPPTPLLPFVTEQAGALRIYWDGTFVPAGTLAPMDFARVSAYAVPAAEFSIANPLDQTAIVGSFTSATGGEITAALDPGAEYVVFLVTWSQAGKFSVPSDAVTATVGEPLQGEQGIPGPPGENGESLFTWLKYADDASGAGMSDSPVGKTYMGLAYNKASATESSNAADYQWSLIKGADGAPGSQGVPGTPGSSLYTWVKYADSSTGANMSDDPTGKMYIGLAYNKASATESSTPADYTWSLFRGTPDPIAAPTGSPSISVTGTTSSFVVETTDIDPGTRVQYHVSTVDGFTPDSTTLYVETQAQVAVITTMPNNSPFSPTTPYFFRVIAENDIGAASPSAQVQANLNLSNIDKVVAANLVAGFALLGSIQVGQILIDADDGISIAQPGGGYSLKIPSNGSDPIELVAQIVTNKLNVEDNLSIAGNAQLLGDFELTNGISNPVGQPTISNYYPTVDTGLGDFDVYHGMVEDPNDPNNFVTSIALLGSGIRFVNKYTGVVPFLDPTSGKAWTTNFDAWGGITYLGGYYYVFGQDRDRNVDFVTNRTFLYKIDASTWNKVAELECYDSSTFGEYRPRLGTDGTGIYLFWVNSSGAVRFRRTTAAMSSWTSATTIHTISTRRSVADVVYGNYDGIGSARWWVALDGGQDKVYAFTADANGPVSRSSTYDFEKATNGAMGMCYDTSRSQMLSVDHVGKLYRYGRYPTDRTILGKYAWLDDNATGGTHETVPGPLRTATIKARAYTNVNTTSPPDLLNTDALNTDKANKVAGYFSDDSGTTWRRKVFQPNRTMTSTRTSGSATISGSFTDADLGSYVTGTGIPADAYIKYRLSTTQAVLSANATSSTTGTVTVTPPNPWGTALQNVLELPTGTPKTTNEFLTSTLATPGKIRSEAESASSVDGSLSKIQLKGDGTFRLGNLTHLRHAGSRTMTGTQSIPAGSHTVVNFGSTKETATGVTWDTGNSRWIINKDGVYLVSLCINWNNTPTTGRRLVQVWKNGAQYAINESPGSAFGQNTNNQQVVTIVPCVAGDYLDARVFQNSGGNLTVNPAADEYRHFFSISFMQT